MTDTPAQLLSIQQVASRLQLSTRTVRRKIQGGAIPAMRLGELGPLRVPADELEAYLEQRRVHKEGA